MSLVVKIMTEASPLHGSFDDANPLANHEIIADVTHVVFGRAQLVEADTGCGKFRERPFVELDGERVYTNGNVYVMNEAGRTISKYQGHILHAPEELSAPKPQDDTNAR